MRHPLLDKIRAGHLNDEQKKAVCTLQGKILILAGAGSGKTSTLAYRMAYLIENASVPPSAILGLTFTNKAAQEMRERIAKILPKEKVQPLTLCTFHSFCMQVLKENIERLGYTKRFSLYDEQDVKRLIAQLAQSLLDHEGQLPSLEETLYLLKEKQQKGDSPLPYSSQWHKQFVENLHQHLEMTLRAYNAVDFDSLISLTVKLFQTHPDILALYQERFRYIMIDEYQDTNPMQYALASLLASKYNNLCVVGDDDQSIYGWRGAEVKHILEFNYDTLIKLEQNYRSSKNILEAANAVIQHNSQRHAKTLWSQKTDEYPLYVFHAPTEKEEAEAVVQRLINLRQELGYDWKDFAILYRSNQLSRCFESALMQAAWKEDNQWRRGIPYQVFGGTELYEKSEIKDLLAYLKVIANPLDQASLLRIINYPRRGISEQTLDLLTSTHRSLKLPLWHLLQALERDAPEYQELIHKLSTKAYPSIAAFVRLIEQAMRRFTSYPLHEALRWLVDTID
ncbi:MAG: ATP-dependent DNA helicase, partial [Chlamydiae bacterium]|nr:ATP-dependent DNA helicase [Chlamydiota bacterium]